MPLLDLFSVSGGLQVPQTALSDSGGSPFTGGSVKVEGLRIGGGLDTTMVLIVAAALIAVYLATRK